MLPLTSIIKLLPRQESRFADEAEERTRQFAERWNIKPSHFDNYVTMSRFLYSGALDADRLEAACTVHSIFFFIDDLFFDTDKFNPDDFGIAPEIGSDLSLVSGFLADLMNTFRTHRLSARPTLIEQAFCEAGKLVARQCDPDWFLLFSDGIEEYITAVMAREVDLRTHKTILTNLQSFLDIRERDTGGLHTCQLIELTKDAFLPPEVRANDVVDQLTWLAIRMASFVNDIFSYHKDVVLEGSEFNLVKIYMDLEGLSFEQAVTQSVQLVNSYANTFVDLRADLPVWGDEVDAVVQKYVDALAEMMTGNVYWHSTTNRYRSPESPFKELRRVV